MKIDSQIDSLKGFSTPSVITLTDGSFVFFSSTSSYSSDSTFDIKGQRFDANGITQGAGFRVNSFTLGDQMSPSETGLTDGGFVVTWTSLAQDGLVGEVGQRLGQDGSDNGIYGQRYDANGNTQGAEFRVNSTTLGSQHDSSVTELNGGGFVVTWTSWGQNRSDSGIYGQRYDANGVPQGTEFRVNSFNKFAQGDSTVTGLTDGGFMVTWKSTGQDGASGGIYGQRYDANGTRLGTEFRVNSFTKTNQQDASVAGLTDGGFVVIWTSFGQDGSGSGIYGQRYDANSHAQGAEFGVNSYTLDAQMNSSVTALTDGGFVVIWNSQGQDGKSGAGIYGQRYDADGIKQGTEFGVSSFNQSLIVTHHQSHSVTALSDGGFMVTWFSKEGRDGFSSGTHVKRYDATGNEVEWVDNINAAPKTPADPPNNNDRLISADSGLALDLDGSAGEVAKLIGAVFGAESVSNASYVATGLYYLDNGTSYEDLAAGAITFTDAKTPEQVTTLMWENVMGSTPAADDIQPYINMLNSGTSIGELGVLAADSLKNQANIDLVGLSDSGIIFDPLHYQPINSKIETNDSNPDGHVSSPLAKQRAEKKKNLSLESAESMLPVTDDENNSDPAPSLDLTSNLFL